MYSLHPSPSTYSTPSAIFIPPKPSLVRSPGTSTLLNRIDILRIQFSWPPNRFWTFYWLPAHFLPLASMSPQSTAFLLTHCPLQPHVPYSALTGCAFPSLSFQTSFSFNWVFSPWGLVDLSTIFIATVDCMCLISEYLTSKLTVLWAPDWRSRWHRKPSILPSPCPGVRSPSVFPAQWVRPPRARPVSRDVTSPSP